MGRASAGDVMSAVELSMCYESGEMFPLKVEFKKPDVSLINNSLYVKSVNLC